MPIRPTKTWHRWNFHKLISRFATQRLFPKLGYRFAGEIGLAFRPGLRFFCYEKRLVAGAETRSQ